MKKIINNSILSISISCVLQLLRLGKMITAVINILSFFPGGPEGGPFGTIVYNGAVAAAEHTGCKVDYYWSQWNSEIMIKTI